MVQGKGKGKMIPGKDYVGVGVGAFLLNDNGEVLLTLRSKNSRIEPGKWMLVGGKVDYNEKIQDAIKREVKEETGVDVEIGKFVTLVNHILPDEEQHWVAPVMECRIKEGQIPKVMEPDKHDEIRWFKLSPEGLPPKEKLSVAAQLVFKQYFNDKDVLL